MPDTIITKLQNDISVIEQGYTHISQSQENLLESFFILAVVLVLGILYISFVAFIRGRDAEKGKIEGRLESLDLLLKEQKKITETVEGIRSDIEKGAWLEKEKNAIKRQKIEEMMSYLSSINDYLYEKLRSLADSQIRSNKDDPISQLLDTVTLYFEPNEIEGISAFYELQSEIATLIEEHATKNSAHFREHHQYLIPNT